MTTAEVTGTGTRRLLVPLYVYPGMERPDAWDHATGHADRLAWVVLNPGSGPGAAALPEFAEASARLRAAGVPLLGYVDTDYGRRGHHAVVADIERYQDWYRVDGVFLDQAASDPDYLAHYRRLAVAARSLEAGTVVLNPGVHPHPGFAEAADVLITFEGSWADYLRIRPPAWTAEHPPRRFGHLVHSAPPDACARIEALARLHGAEYCYATPGTGGNPWSVPTPLLEAGAGLGGRIVAEAC